MKKVLSLASLILTVSVLAVLTSCQQEDVGNVQNDGNLKFLSVTPGYLNNLTFYPNDSNMINLYEAFGRYIDAQNNGRPPRTASEIHISQELYDYLSISFFGKNKIKTRSGNKDNGTLSEDPNDCVACTIAELYCELAGYTDYKIKKAVYKQIWELMGRINAQQGLFWYPEGEWYKKLLRACFENIGKNLHPTNYDCREEALRDPPQRCIGVIEIDKEKYHSIKVIHIDSNTKYVYYYDNQTHQNGVIELEKLKGIFIVSGPLEPNFTVNYYSRNY